MRIYYVYLLSSLSRRLYTGVTNDLISRVWQHKNNVNNSFTSRYNIHRLVYYEEYEYVHDAIAREKQIKLWKRIKKEALIESANKSWRDLSEGWYQ